MEIRELLIGCLAVIAVMFSTGCGVTIRGDYYGKTEKYDQSGTLDFSKLFGQSKPRNRE